MFLLEIARKMDVFEGKIPNNTKQLTNLDRNKVLQSMPRATMFVLTFPIFNHACYLATPQVIA